MPKELDVKGEMLSAVKRMPLIAVVVTGVLGVTVAALCGVVAFIGYQFLSDPAGQDAREVINSPSGRVQSIIGLADCFASDACPPNRDPAADAAEQVAATSTINGTTFTDMTDRSWEQWGRAFMKYGHLEQDSVRQISTGTDTDTVQVTTSDNTTMICTINWDNDKKLSAWKCYSDDTPQTGSSR